MHGRARSTKSVKQSENQDSACKDDALEVVEVWKVHDIFCHQEQKSMTDGSFECLNFQCIMRKLRLAMSARGLHLPVLRPLFFSSFSFCFVLFCFVQPRLVFVNHPVSRPYLLLFVIFILYVTALLMKHMVLCKDNNFDVLYRQLNFASKSAAKWRRQY